MLKKYFYDYPENRAINLKLTHGDRIKISHSTGYTSSYVNSVLQGRRKNNRIIESAIKLIEMNNIYVNG